MQPKARLKFFRLLLDLPVLRKILLAFLILLIIPFIIFGLISTNSTKNVLYEQIENYNMKMMAQSLSIFNNELRSIEEASLLLFANDSLQKILSKPDTLTTNPGQLEYDSQQLESALLNFTQQTGLKQVTLYHDKANLIAPYGYKYLTYEEASTQPWYLQAEHKNGGVAWYSDISNDGANPNENFLTLARQLKHIYTNRVIGYMEVNIPASYFMKLLNETQVVNTGTTLLLNAQGSYVLGTDSVELSRWIDETTNLPEVISKFGDTLVEWKPDHSMPTYLVFHGQLNDQLHLINFYEKNEVLKPAFIIQRKDIVIFSLSVLLAAVLMVYLHTMFIRPLRKLALLMESFDKGNLEHNMPYAYRADEIGFIFRMFRKMIANMKQLIDQVYKERLRKQEAEIKALQSQINPHLLYNTLDSIHLLAIKHKVPEIQSMITALSKFFRISFSKGESIITIKEEIQHAEAFLVLQKYRVNYEIDISIEMDHDIIGCETVKCILQPIIENSLFHGLSNQEDGILSIKGYSHNGYVHLDIYDNGKGFSHDKWEFIKQNQGKEHHGMWNVHQRIQLVYGEAYGISLPDISEKGTLVRIRLPYRLHSKWS